MFYFPKEPPPKETPSMDDPAASICTSVEDSMVARERAG